MEGDPAIRWQTMRWLLDSPDEDWQRERRRVTDCDGWVRKFIAEQELEGTWGGGIYSPKWTSTTYTLLTLIECGVDHSCSEAVLGAELIFDRGLGWGTDLPAGNTGRIDLCVLGFWLRIGAVFLPTDRRPGLLVDRLLAAQMADGGWNCRAGRVANVVHSSFHTTFNVLDGLAAAAAAGLVDASTYEKSRDRALEFMLAHQLYRSDKTGQIIDKRFTEFADPVRWHYDVLRGLDFIAATNLISDPRLADPLHLLLMQRTSSGRWRTRRKHAGKVFFDMERQGESRWSTFRALRVLRAAGCSPIPYTHDLH